MFVFTLKATTLKYIGVMALCIVAMVVTVSLVPASPKSEYVETAISVDYKNVKGEDGRRKFIENFGWEIVEGSESASDITIPEQFDDTYEEYNALQKKFGLDLEKYKGKKAKLYTYTITNHKGGKALASIIVYKNRVIAGDVKPLTADSAQTGLFDIENQY